MSSLKQAERTSLVAIGRQYKHHGLGAYIALLERSSSENCQALFAFSLLLCSLCLAELQHDYAQRNLDPMTFFSSLLNISNLASGCIAIADQYRVVLKNGNLAPLLGSDLQTGQIQDVPAGLSEALERVLQGVQHSPGDLPSADTSGCVAALNRLKLMYPANGQPSGSRAALIAWPVLGGKDFLKLMHSQDTLALVCLAHYGAILHKHQNVWFLEGLGAKLVASVLQVVPDSSRGYLHWAATTVS